MNTAYISTRLHRTTSKLALHDGDLRTRLPIAFDDGYGTVSTEEIASLGSSDLSADFKELKATLSKCERFGESSAELTVQQMSDDEVARIASRIVDFASRVENQIEYTKKEHS